MKPRSRPPQKKIRIFYAPRFFSGQNRIKSAQITRKNTVFHADRQTDRRDEANSRFLKFCECAYRCGEKTAPS